MRGHESGVVCRAMSAPRSGSQRRSGPPAAAAGGQRFIPGVLGGPEHRVEGLRARPEFGGVRLADDDRIRGAQPRHHCRIEVRHPIGERGRAERGAQPVRHLQIFDRDGNAVQTSGCIAACQHAIALCRGRQGALLVNSHEGVELGIGLRNPPECGLGKLH